MKTTCRTITEKVAVVTGGAKGIGAQIARRFSNAGYAVALSYRNSEAAADRLVEELTAHGGKAIAIKADVSDERGAKALRDAVMNAYGRADALINNAGTSAYSLLVSMSEAEIERVLGDNLKSAIYVNKAFYDDFAFGRQGVIVNVSSLWGVVGASYEAVYSAAKAGVIGLTKSLAKELAPCGVRVNAVAPGAIMTDMIAHLTADELEALRKEIPLGRIGEPRDVAETVYFLASEKASYITGQTIIIG